MSGRLLSLAQNKSGQDIRMCYQCGKCSSGCPLVFSMDIPPHLALRSVILGDDRVLSCQTIWLCTSCHACGARCPNKIDSSRVFDALKQIALEEKIKAGDSRVRIFHGLFLGSIVLFGRLHEASMLGLLKLKTLDLFSDIPVGIKMLLKGKLGIFPHLLKNRSAWRKYIREKRNA